MTAVKYAAIFATAFAVCLTLFVVNPLYLLGLDMPDSWLTSRTMFLFVIPTVVFLASARLLAALFHVNSIAFWLFAMVAWLISLGILPIATILLSCAIYGACL